MVQANVGQKRLKRNILRCFSYRSYALANFHLSDAWCKSSIISLIYYFSTPE
jgi:hypothetical protein